MNIKIVSLAAAMAIASTAAFAQSGAMGTGSQGVGSNMTAGDKMNSGASTKPSPKDASTSGANTAGAVDKKGDAASPGGTMKK